MATIMAQLRSFIEDITQSFPNMLASNGAFLAGGAVRDTILGREVKDLDIFIPNGNTLFGRLFYSTVAQGAQEYPIESYKVFNATTISGRKVQFVLTSTPLFFTETLSSFPLSICKCAVEVQTSKPLKIETEKDFIETMLTKVIKVDPFCDMDYLNRIKLKYANEYSFCVT